MSDIENLSGFPVYASEHIPEGIVCLMSGENKVFLNTRDMELTKEDVEHLNTLKLSVIKGKFLGTVFGSTP